MTFICTDNLPFHTFADDMQQQNWPPIEHCHIRNPILALPRCFRPITFVSIILRVEKANF